MARYSTREFGEIETVWNNVPSQGILLRESNGTVFLEQHFKDEEGESQSERVKEEAEKKAQREVYEKIVKRSETHPWNFYM